MKLVIALRINYLWDVCKIIMSDIVSLLKSKKEVGLVRLYDQYASTLLGIIERIVKHRGTSEEVLQQTFLKIWNNIDSYDSEKSAFFSWMYTIARNAALDKVRLKNFSSQKKTDSFDSTVHDNEVAIDPGVNMDVQKLIETLDVNQKEVLDLVYLQGYSHRDAAEELSIPLGTVKTRLRLALNNLRNTVDKDKRLFLGGIILLIILILL